MVVFVSGLGQSIALTIAYTEAAWAKSNVLRLVGSVFAFMPHFARSSLIVDQINGLEIERRGTVVKTVLAYSLCAAVLLISGLARAQEAIRNPVLVGMFATRLDKSPVSQKLEDKAQSRNISTAIVRCANPEGTGIPTDKLYCAFAKPDNSPVDEDVIEDATLTENLTKTLANSRVTSVGMGQGWIVTAALLRCSAPFGTKHPSPADSCELDWIRQQGE